MSSAAKVAANIANAQLSTGPRTAAGRAISSKNAIKSGLFSTSDFIRPGEEPLYTELDDALRTDLAPSGQLEHHFVAEIRRAMWRLRRCGEMEAGMVDTCADTSLATSNETCTGTNADTNPIPDPMQNEATARIQYSIDRARAQCHRLVNRSTAELRKLQTERHFRHEFFGPKADLADLGLCDWRSINKGVDEKTSAQLRRYRVQQVENEAMLDGNLRQALAVPMDHISFAPCEKPLAKQTQTPRNARCTCGSGQKYKRCCGREAAPPVDIAQAA